MSAWDIAKIFLILFILAGIMYLMLWAVKKYFFSFSKGKLNASKIQVLSTQGIMPKKYVSVVKIYDKVLILGISEHSVNLLEKLDYVPDEFEYISKNHSSGMSFLDHIKQSIGKR